MSGKRESEQEDARKGHAAVVDGYRGSGAVCSIHHECSIVRPGANVLTDRLKK